jgi:hypothetical protein
MENVTEVDHAEAFRPLMIVQWMFTAIYVLLGVSSVAIFIFTLIVAKMRREAQKAAIESKQLGQCPPAKTGLWGDGSRL